MEELKIGEVIKTIVIGFQPYGIFIRCFDNQEYTGLIHISEISNDFIKNVNKVAKLEDIIYAKILDIDKKSKHVKLSIKATQPKVRYKLNYFKVKENPEYSDFSMLKSFLPIWINQQLKEKSEHD